MLRHHFGKTLLLTTATFLWGRDKYLSSIKLNDYKGKYVLITGCDGGTGRLAVRRFHEEGFKVIATTLTKEARDELNEEYKDKDNNKEGIISIQMDIANDSSVKAAYDLVFKNLSENYQQLWAVVNNAGFSTKVGPAYWMNVNDYSESMKVNFYGTLNVAHTFMPLLIQSEGRLITNTSAEVLLAVPHFSVYSSSKSALHAYLDASRSELKNFKVKCIEIQHDLTVNTNFFRTISQQFQRSWQECPPAIRQLYDEESFAKIAFQFEAIQLERTFPKLVTPRQIADDYLRAAIDKYPKSVYRRGFVTGLLRFLGVLSPDNVIRKVVLNNIYDGKQ